MDGWKATATVQFDAKAPCTDFSLAGPVKSKGLRVAPAWFIWRSTRRRESLVTQYRKEQVVLSGGERSRGKRDLVMIPQPAQSLPI